MIKIEHKILDVLRSSYNVFNFLLYKGGKKEEFSIFVISVPSVEDLDYDWEKIVSKIAVEYQSQLGKGPELWNVYLVFIAHFEIPRGLKYKIENDKYSSRKIVFDKLSETIEESEITRLISERIFELNIETQKSQKSSRKDLCKILDPKLYEEISRIDLDGLTRFILAERERIFKKLLKGYSHEI